MLLSEEGIIAHYMPVVRTWALKFVGSKGGRKVEDVEDYIQAAYIGLIEYVVNKGEILDEDMGLVRLYVKHELFKHAWQTLQLKVPYNDYMELYLEVERKVESLNELISATYDLESDPPSMWGFGTQISLDERIDLKDTVDRMSPTSKKIYEHLRKGDTITEITEHTGSCYTTVYDQISRMRNFLKTHAHLDFLIFSQNITEGVVTYNA